MTVRIEKEGPVTIVVLNRPQARNAVDRGPQGAQHFASGAGRHGTF